MAPSQVLSSARVHELCSICCRDGFKDEDGGDDRSAYAHAGRDLSEIPANYTAACGAVQQFLKALLVRVILPVVL